MDQLSTMGLSYFDITIVALMLLLGIKGFLNGFIKEVFGLIGLIAGVYLASRLSADAAQFLNANFLDIKNMALLKLIGFLAILTLIWLSSVILGAIVAKLMHKDERTFFGSFGGFVAAVCKYFIVFSLIVTVLSQAQLSKDKLQKYIQNSYLYPYMLKVGSFLVNINNTTQALNIHVDTDEKDTKIKNIQIKSKLDLNDTNKSGS